MQTPALLLKLSQEAGKHTTSGEEAPLICRAVGALEFEGFKQEQKQKRGEDDRTLRHVVG